MVIEALNQTTNSMNETLKAQKGLLDLYKDRLQKIDESEKNEEKSAD